MFLTILLFTAFIILFISYIWILKSRYNYFIQRGIPGPPPQFFFGHLLKLWKSPLSFNQIYEWTRRYGPIYGIFQGSHPLYIVSDADILQEVYIKQFSSFHSRPLTFINHILQEKGSHLFFAQGNVWRRQRHVINPTFTAAKLKSMTTEMNQCIQSMISKFEQTDGQDFDIFPLYKRLTMDIIWHCVFGIDTNMQNDIDNIYMKKSMASVAVQIDKLPIVKLSMVMPFLVPLLTAWVKARAAIVDKLRATIPWLVRNVEELPTLWIAKQVQNVVKERLKSGKKQTDLLQMMMDVATDKAIKDSDKDESMPKYVSYREMLQNIFLFMVAGFDTTATVLCYSTYVLATQPEVQKKLQAEIDEHWQENEKEPNYDVITNIPYIDLFIREVLRLYSFSGRVRMRKANETTVICGHQIEKGSYIMPDVSAINRNIDLWGPEDVNKFIPERHAVKRHPAAYFAFGVGPRNCVGMKFALMIIKLCLAHILHTYNILPGEHIEEGMTLRETNVISPTGVFIKLEKRLKLTE